MATSRLKMKDLESATGVSRETIRFYIRERLLPEPERTGRNVAWYDESFIERIALIKRLQSERFLPLGIIKAIVAGDDPPPEEQAETLAAIDEGLSARGRTGERRLPERLERIGARVSVSVDEIRELAALGTLEICTRDGGEWLEDLSIQVVEAWADMRSGGLTATRGFDSGIMEIYVQMLQWLAREEIRMFTERVTGKVRGEELAQMAEVGIRTGGRMMTAIRERTIRQYVAEGNVPRVTARLRSDTRRRSRQSV
ncbi:MAG: MerR family transcriptional regulator [Vicinamibacterales bacterium]